MILSLILELLFNLLDLIFSLLPDIFTNGFDKIFDAIGYIFNAAIYFLPADALRFVMTYIAAKWTFKLIVKVISFAKRILPFM